MKRAAFNHPKLLRLAMALRLSRWGAVGILESMWNFTSVHAIQGDIGRWTNREIAEAIDWRGDPDRLIDALVESGWLDVPASDDPAGGQLAVSGGSVEGQLAVSGAEQPASWRLVVHGWAEHCTKSVLTTLKNKGLTIAEIQNRRLAKPPAVAVAVALALALPEPEPSAGAEQPPPISLPEELAQRLGKVWRAANSNDRQAQAVQVARELLAVDVGYAEIEQEYTEAKQHIKGTPYEKANNGTPYGAKRRILERYKPPPVSQFAKPRRPELSDKIHRAGDKPQ